MPQTDPAQTTADPLDQLNLVNAGYVADLYEQYRQDPASVDPEWRSMFDRAPAASSRSRRRLPPATATSRQRQPLHPPLTRHTTDVRAIGPGRSDPDQGAGRAGWRRT